MEQDPKQQEPEFSQEFVNEAEAEQKNNSPDAAYEEPEKPNGAEKAKQIAIEKETRKYKISRSNLLLVAAFSFINVILTSVQSNFYLLFSSTLPIFVSQVGINFGLLAEGEESLGTPFFAICVVIAIILIVPYLLCYFLSKKHFAWMIAALVLFSIDSVFLLFLFDINYILDAIFHVWVMYYLIVGVRSGSKLRKLQSGAVPPITVEKEQF